VPPAAIAIEMGNRPLASSMAAASRSFPAVTVPVLLVPVLARAV
jgi:hypothetical protein